ncbi:hypothetical protein [Halocynthiibacter namhaensis]|uniref:hypothetical protein n=1 Tax=Halocynthiibacter namhaensis TaxID=1290553 RepID=UPI0012E043C0|nr:hypothetical protein [Halocynthiibacter namhaensis]
MKPQNGSKNVKHLKNNNGSWTYRRRVPERYHKTLGFKVWNRPCGDVSYQQAVVMVTDWAVEDDALIKSLDDPTKAAKVRQDAETAHWEPYVERILEGIKEEKDNSGALFWLVDEDGNESPYDGGPIYSLEKAKDDIKAIDINPVLDDAERLVRYQNVLKIGFQGRKFSKHGSILSAITVHPYPILGAHRYRSFVKILVRCVFL